MEECCSTKPKQENKHEHKGHDHDHEHSHDTENKSVFRMFIPAIVSFALLLIGIALDHMIKPEWFAGIIRIIWYLAAYIPVGLPVLKEALSRRCCGNALLFCW